MKEVSRNVFGITPTKIHKNKRKYTRKQKHKNIPETITIM